MLRFPLTLVIDDECDTRFFNMPHGNSNVVYVRNSQEALGILARAWTEQKMNRQFDPENHIIQWLYLDYDLGDDDTIMPVVNFLLALAHANEMLWIGGITIHSMNPASMTLVKSLKDVYGVEYQPYHTLTRI